MTFNGWFHLSSVLLIGNGLLALWLAELLGTVETLLFGAGTVLAFRREMRGVSPATRRLIQRIATALLPVVLAIDVVYLADSLLHSLIRLLTLLGFLKLVLRTQDRDFRDLFVISFFQLVAASAYTTTMAFAVVFLVYLSLGTWAFLLLHLKQQDAGRGREWDALPAKLLPTGLAVSVMALAMATVFFVTIPRVGRAFLPGRAAAGPLLAGFAERVELGSFGTIQTDSSVVMRVRLPGLSAEDAQALPIRWRGVAFDRFDGDTWAVSESARAQAIRSAVGLATLAAPSGSGRLVRQEIALEPIGTTILFVAPRPIQLLGPFPTLFRDISGTVSVPLPPAGRVTYAALSEIEPDDPFTRGRVAQAPETAVRDGYLQLPPLRPRVRALARALAGGARDRHEAVRRVEAYLRDGYRYSLDLHRDSRFDPLEDFLFVQRAGNCEYFAASMAVLLRAVGVPTRVVNGFQRGEWNEYGGYFVVRQRDAHSWVEAYLPGAGWVTFDPSPRASSGAIGNGTLARLARYFDALGMRWDRYVVAYSLFDQLRLLSAARHKADLLRGHAVELFSGLGDAARRGARLVSGGGAPRDVWFLAGLGVLVAGLLLALRTRPAARTRPRDLERSREVRFYRELLRALSRRGFVKHPAATPREFATTIETGGPSDLTDLDLSSVMDLYYQVRYGRRRLSERDHARVAHVLRRAIGTRRPGGGAITAPAREAVRPRGPGAGDTTP
jgi:transglutaminase-like putative cysteine protease